MYSEESCGNPPGGGTTAGGSAAAGSWVSGAGAGGTSGVASEGALPVVVEAGVAVVGRGARFGLGIGCEE
jgi:hypothetical protein